MDRNPKKSKALIITIVIVLLLVVAGYLVFKNSDKIFGKKDSTISKIFAPLLGSSKPKDVNTVDTNTGDQNTGGDNGDTNSSSNTGGSSNNSGNGSSAGNGSSTGNTSGGGTSSGGGTVSSIVPPFNPIPTPTQTPTPCVDSNGDPTSCAADILPTTLKQCSDGVDNDGDGKKDGVDSSCHTDFNASNSLSYDKNINDEGRVNNTNTAAPAAMCPDDPLVFTEEEKAQLTVLLRQYYLLAPTLRIEDDITLLDYDNQTNEELVKQATILIQDCRDQKSRLTYTGPKEIKDNPYYQGINTGITGASSTTTTTTPGSNLPACNAGYTTIGGITYNSGLGIGGMLGSNTLYPCTLNPVSPTSTSTTTSSIGGPEYIPGYGLYELMFNIW